MEDIGCIFCGTESSQAIIEEKGYTGRKCAQCGLIYVSPRPSRHEIVDLYGHDAAHITAGSHISAEVFKRLYARHHLRILSSVATGGTLLEIGAGAGYFLDEARRWGFEPYGIELNPLQAGFIRDTFGIPCEVAPLSASTFGQRKFDIVYHCDVVSHFFDPISEFQNMAAILKNGGVLVFETGNLAEVDLPYLRRLSKFQYPDHLFFFGTDHLRRLLEPAGFTIQSIQRYSILPQLRVTKWAAKARSLLSKPPQGSASGATAARTAGRPASLKPCHHGPIPRRAIQWIWAYSNYLLRYKVGSIAPKRHRPQTIIVVARKTRETGTIAGG
jgi:SAM-dependent methyltransferase